MTHRRTLLLAGAALAAPRIARAQAWPTRPVTLVTGYAPGGLTDLTARAIAERMQRDLGQTVLVDPKPGGATSLSATQVAQARPDGYTLLMGATSLAINPALQPSLTPRDPRRELLPVGMAYTSPFVLHVHPDLPVRTLPELIAYGKARPGQLNFGSSGTGAVNHLCLEMFKRDAGIDVVHIPYRGGAPALIDLRAGRIQGMFAAVLEALPTIREGHTRAIAMSSAARLPLMADVPAVAETLPGYDGVFWQGLFAPIGTPAPIVERAATVLRAATEDPELGARLAAQGVALQTGNAAYLADLLERETVTWGRLIREANIRAE
ncbi:Bug family tripartite tricarboxylate transporter substrate binding protein [Plastoroseomonas arctica]|uniref:Tripartite tricarboxylate transporter substrate binding protein n=1 Tax=Plastoroseomonas arctica TaxID=1509237 RepID=A0AAF1K180_9PROT|nr:tripartite tricarboxylate transporter substrate binding protein [Plastoroseomonas arctica]MBR0654455.1 tripartite tricarboxylate transporter substrate binding protein [Plastoroseomonas arctica]